MDPFFGISSLPTWLAALLLLGVTTAAAVFAPLYVRRRVSLERLVLNNEVAGFKYATLGVMYAVLVGFVVIMVWEEYENAEQQVREESAVLTAMHRLGDQLPESAREPVEEGLRSYLNAVVKDEWAIMAARRGESDEATTALLQLYKRYLNAESADAREAMVLDKSLDLLIRLNEIRRERLDTAEGTLPPVLGTVLLIGALLTVGFTLFFGAPNVVAQAAMTGIICLMIMLVLFAAMLLNRPFSGAVHISPRPLAEVLEQIEVAEPRM